MKIAGLQKVSLIDYPGHIAATVFLADCNLDCGYCYNRWMIRRDESPEALSVDKLVAWLETRVGLLDGVCVSGGEPTLVPDLDDLLRTIKGLGYQVKLDTNGTRPERLVRLLDDGLVDYVALDFKAPLDERYHQVAGCVVVLDDIARSLQALRERVVPYELRSTVGPALDEDDLNDMAALVRPSERWYLQPFSPAEGVDGVWRERDAMDEETLVGVAARLAERVPGVCVRGVAD
jgi:pyruvate formate lyase activating enzyme